MQQPVKNDEMMKLMAKADMKSPKYAASTSFDFRNLGRKGAIYQ